MYRISLDDVWQCSWNCGFTHKDHVKAERAPPKYEKAGGSRYWLDIDALTETRATVLQPFLYAWKGIIAC